MFFLRNISFFSFLQRAVDFCTVSCGFILGYWFYVHFLSKYIPYSFFSYMLFSLLPALIFLITLHAANLYEREVSLLNLVETRGLLWVWFISSLITLTMTFYIRPLDLSRVMVTASLLFTFILLIFERAIFYRIHLAFHLRGYAKKKILIFGGGDIGRHLLKRVFHSPALGLLPIGVLDDNQALWGKKIHVPEINPNTEGTKVLGGLDELESLVKKHNVEEIFLALPSASFDRTQKIVSKSRELGLKVSMVPHTFDNQIFHLHVEELGGIPIMRERKYRPSYIYLFFKRIFDFCFASVILLLLSPLFLLIFVIIKLDSKGPIIFKQKRIGLGGKEFELFKFRTMYVESPKYAINPLSSADPRITRVGKILRRISVDELPQFINVFLGDMSVVGPRPEMPFIVEGYKEIHRERLLVKPGITGIWQISAVRGEAIHENIEYDLFYIENQSILLDFIIVLRTILVAIRGVGAY